MNTTIRRYALACILGTSATPAISWAQDFTTFIPGLGAPNTWWTRRNTIGRIGAQVRLGTPVNPSVPTLDSVAVQTRTIRDVMINLGGQHALVGHSMGGIVARNATFAAPGRTFGILTIGTPHRGAIVADNAQALNSYIVSTAVTISEGFAGVLGLTPGRVVAALRNVIRDQVQRVVDEFSPANAAATLDARTTSSVITSNKNTTDNLRHAAIYGTMDRRFAWMYLASSAQYGDVSSVHGWRHDYGSAVKILKACQIVRFHIVVSPYHGHLCRRGYKAATSVDERWQAFTAGGNVPSDAWIPNSSSAYPGTTLSDGATNRRVNLLDHNSLLTEQAGVDAIARALKEQLLMTPP
jgi:pimeloyl-ACP methyl ester carboxylesterase